MYSQRNDGASMLPASSREQPPTFSVFTSGLLVTSALTGMIKALSFRNLFIQTRATLDRFIGQHDVAIADQVRRVAVNRHEVHADRIRQCAHEEAGGHHHGK